MSRLYVGNLNSSITKQKLADTFIKYGPLVDIWYNSGTYLIVCLLSLLMKEKEHYPILYIET
jgi:RNA recognition motif-containing protein